MDNTAQASSNMNLLDVLLNEHLISQKQHQEIKVKVATLGMSDDEVVKREHIVTEEKLAEAKAKMVGIPFVSIENTSFAPEALGKIPEAVVQRFNLIPFLYDEKTKSLSIAMGDPVDLEAASFVRQKTGLNINLVNGYTWNELLELFKNGEIDILPAENTYFEIALTKSAQIEGSIIIEEDSNKDKKGFIQIKSKLKITGSVSDE